MIENYNSLQSSFYNEDVKKAQSFIEKLVSKIGTSLTGTAGCKKASEIDRLDSKILSTHVIC